MPPDRPPSEAFSSAQTDTSSISQTESGAPDPTSPNFLEHLLLENRITTAEYMKLKKQQREESSQQARQLRKLLQRKDLKPEQRERYILRLEQLEFGIANGMGGAVG
ncbi:hypothetical protein HK102_008692 [Quaeritorhiza haematococci]|nr:hypothetical protein HK102_008692 [Quaeritorhiza haematococci]